MLDVKHHVVISDAIGKEWRLHGSRYSRKWLTGMWARKRVDRKEIEPDQDLRKRIDDAVTPAHREGVAKDIHLIEAGLATDRLVTSGDERVRRAFGRASADIMELRQIVWVNPTKPEEKPIDWLRSGARTEEHRQLGSCLAG